MWDLQKKKKNDQKSILSNFVIKCVREFKLVQTNNLRLYVYILLEYTVQMH